ncbi:MAG TPA: RHS repeat domain-containing protein [Allosphingosinicella sp.]|nr:RHS repeat domain-containing protein [Allosphingosinicella sp.]
MPLYTSDTRSGTVTFQDTLGTVASEWDIAGRRTKLTWPDGFYVTYDHLLTGETIAIRENGAASGIGVIGTIVYDDLGRRTSLTLGNGVATTYAYDPLSRLGELKLEFAGTANDLTSQFAYNPASQIASNVRSNDAYAWTGHGSGTTTTTGNGFNR